MSEFDKDENIHKLIDLIYATASEPERWPELLQGLTLFIDSIDTSLTSYKPQQNNVSHQSIPEGLSTAKTLHEIPDISNISTDNAIQNEDSLSLTNQYLFNHFQRALKIAQRLLTMEDERQVINTVLDRLPVSIFLVNHAAVVIETNAIAQHLLQDNEFISIANQKLLGSNTSVTNKMHSAIANIALRNSGSQTIALSDHDQGSAIAYLSPIIQHSNLPEPMVAVFISTRLDKHITIPNSFAKHYALTPAEAKVSQHIVTGNSVSEIAKQTNVSENTVRTQLKSVMAKTNTKRQAELVSLILTEPSVLLENNLKEQTLPIEILANKVSTALTENGQQNFIVLNDGRQLCYKEYGDPNGIPLIHCHSVVGCREEIPYHGAQIAKVKGIRLIVPDRPGFGQSDSVKHFSFVTWVEDLKQLLDSLHIQSCYVMGYLMGAVYACASALLLPDRVKHLTLISFGVIPETKEDFAEMTPLYRVANKMARDFPTVHEVMISLMRRSILHSADKYFKELLATSASGDMTLFAKAGFKERMFAIVTESFKQGSKGCAKEITNAMSKNGWGYNVEDIITPVTMWNGQQDAHFPYILSQKLAKKFQHVTTHSFPDQGHFLFYSHGEQIFEQILQFHNANHQAEQDSARYHPHRVL